MLVFGCLLAFDIADLVYANSLCWKGTQKRSGRSDRHASYITSVQQHVQSCIGNPSSMLRSGAARISRHTMMLE
jgi:hypothetical protein